MENEPAGFIERRFKGLSRFAGYRILVLYKRTDKIDGTQI